MAKKSKPALKLDRIAAESRFVAAQAEILSEILSEVPTLLGMRDLVRLLSPETVLLEHYKEPDKYWQWLYPSLLEYLREDEDFNLATKNSVVYRYVLLPLPGFLDNWYQRRLLIQAILLHLHVQLWFGVICGVFFVDQRKVDFSGIRDKLNFMAMPEAQMVFDVPGFHSQSDLDLHRLRDSASRERLDLLDVFLAHSSRPPVWLFYDEENFGSQRLSGWRWESLRTLFLHLYTPFRCIGCGSSMKSFALDHIAPVSRGYYQTLLNLQPLCRSCNSAKRALEGDDPFGIRLLIPEHLRTRVVEDLMRQPPRWLGKIARPGGVKEVVKTT